jgi:hypothetical protein
MMGFNYKYLKAKEIPKTEKKKSFSKPDSLNISWSMGFCMAKAKV